MQKLAEIRIKNAMIPAEFEDARFDNFRRETETQTKMYDAMLTYLKAFKETWRTSTNSFGFVAVHGESFIKALPAEERLEYREDHSNYGIGKTHLQMAAAKYLMNNFTVIDEYNKLERACRVLCIQDVTFMEDLNNAKMEDKEQYVKMLKTATEWADVLIWDDLGKSKHTQSREQTYYRIINDRYNSKKPIIFSSNEDADTIEEKIGYAAADRLFGMAKNHFYALEGESQRTI